MMKSDSKNPFSGFQKQHSSMSIDAKGDLEVKEEGMVLKSDHKYQKSIISVSKSGLEQEIFPVTEKEVFNYIIKKS